MNNLVKINNNDLSVKEFEGQRIVTFKDIDMLHERVEGTAKRNFNGNKKHLVKDVDYFFVKPADVQKYEIRTSQINNRGTYLITESGYLMLVKSLQDDEYEQVKARVFLLLGISKWEDLDIDGYKEILPIIDESIRIVKLDRPQQINMWE